jgi:hypothetical protein
MAVCAAAAHCHALDALLEQYATAGAPYDVGSLEAQPSFEAVAAFAHAADSPLLAYFTDADVLTPELLVEALDEKHADGSTHTYTHVPALAAALWSATDRRTRMRRWWMRHHADTLDVVYFRLLTCGLGGLVLVRMIFFILLVDEPGALRAGGQPDVPVRAALMNGLSRAHMSCARAAHTLVSRDVVEAIHIYAQPLAWFESEHVFDARLTPGVYDMWGYVVLVYALVDADAAVTWHQLHYAKNALAETRACDMYMLFEAAIVGSNVELLTTLARLVDEQSSSSTQEPEDFMRSTPYARPSVDFVRRALAPTTSHAVRHYLYAHDTFGRALLAPELAPERARACCVQAQVAFARAVLQSNDVTLLARHCSVDVLPYFKSSFDFNLGASGAPSALFVEAVLAACGHLMTPEQEGGNIGLEHVPLASVPPLAFMTQYRTNTPTLYVLAALRDASPDTIVETLAPVKHSVVLPLFNDEDNPWFALTPTMLTAMAAYGHELAPRHYPLIATTLTLHAAFETYLRTASLFVTVHHAHMMDGTHTSALTPLIRAAFAERDQATLARELLDKVERGSIYLFRAAAYIEPAYPGTPWVSSLLIELILGHFEDGHSRSEYAIEIIRSRLLRPTPPPADHAVGGGARKRATSDSSAV